MRRTAIAVVMLAVLPCAAACAAGDEVEGYHCTLREGVVTDTVDIDANLASVSASASTGFAELRRPGQDGRLFAGYLVYRLAGGAKLDVAAALGGAEIGVTTGTRVGFYYESPERDVIEEVLAKKIPPSGWARMSVELDAGVAGSAQAGIRNVVGAEVAGEARTSAELTRHADTGMTVTREWSGTLVLKPAGNATARLGLERPSGKVSVSYAVRFDGGGTARRLTVVAEAPAGRDRVRQITRILDLRAAADARAVRRALPEIIANPLALAPRGANFFLTEAAGALVQRMETRGTTVRALYEVAEKDITHGVHLARFGGAVGRATSRSVLRDIVIRTPGGERRVSCVGRPAAGRVRPGRPPVLPPRCVPPPPPSPEVSTEPPEPMIETEEPAGGPVAAPAPAGAAGPAGGVLRAAWAVPTLMETPPPPTESPAPGETTPGGGGCGSGKPSPSITDVVTPTPTDTPTPTPTDVITVTATPEPSPTDGEEFRTAVPGPTEVVVSSEPAE
ncbi:hypothetical protein [Spongiactinospora sp. TRM90649]|uniref:hypothetical protein n=1 Tax=Spongiactinospora sp. TRM90649 TaxID=3031114 RepID=UPI0023F9FCDC|nr:hypothetical protein [Spongiactinospora sp. TRM90649]MDF5753808.1 hypothetical protein [Spongiactinospora sp. TRM90649]